MTRLLRIADTVDHVFLEMSTVLEPLKPEASALDWTILDLQCVAREDSFDVLSIEQEIQESSTGLQLSFEELLDFASRLLQVIDGLMVGCREPGSFPKRTDEDLTVLNKGNIVLAAIDSSFWLISGPDDVLTRCQTHFKLVTEVDPASISLSTWGRSE